jgi:hypothetical protein
MSNSTLFAPPVKPVRKPRKPRTPKSADWFGGCDDSDHPEKSVTVPKQRKPKTPKAPPVEPTVHVEQPIVPLSELFGPFPMPAMPATPHVPLLDLWPAGNGVMRLWMGCRADDGTTEAYCIRLVNNGLKSQKAWRLEKHSDGKIYDLHEVFNKAILEWELFCDCPGFVAYGLACNGNRSCKHCRMLKALRALTDQQGI